MQYDSIMEILELSLDKLDSEDSYKEYLKVVGRFHTYSADNQLLIYAQMPKAVKLAGAEKWRSLGYKVRQENEIGILVPKFSIRYADNETGRFIKKDELSKSEIDKATQSGLLNKIRVKSGFTGVTVFDISSTDYVDDTAVQKEFEYKNSLLVALSSIMRVNNIEQLKLSDIENMIGRLIKITKTENEIIAGDSDSTKVVDESVTFTVLERMNIKDMEYTFNCTDVWRHIKAEDTIAFKSLLEQISLISDCILSRLESEFGFSEEIALDSVDGTVREDEIDTLLAAMEANAIRYKTGGGTI